jgi:hypothetical protein
MSQWRKPNQTEAAQGYVAMLPRIYHCQTERGMLSIGYSGGYTDKETKTVYPKRYDWEGYTQERLERRATYTDDLPEFWTAPNQDNSAAWLEYIETGVASKEVAKVLPTLGSYEKDAA